MRWGQAMWGLMDIVKNLAFSLSQTGATGGCVVGGLYGVKEQSPRPFSLLTSVASSGVPISPKVWSFARMTHRIH